MDDPFLRGFVLGVEVVRVLHLHGVCRRSASWLADVHAVCKASAQEERHLQAVPDKGSYCHQSSNSMPGSHRYWACESLENEIEIPRGEHHAEELKPRRLLRTCVDYYNGLQLPAAATYRLCVEKMAKTQLSVSQALVTTVPDPVYLNSL